MIKKDEINVVTRVEHHLLCSCPCEDCVRVRAQREQRVPTNNLIRYVKPTVAFALGYIPRRSTHGSLARDLMQKFQDTERRL